MQVQRTPISQCDRVIGSRCIPITLGISMTATIALEILLYSREYRSGVGCDQMYSESFFYCFDNNCKKTVLDICRNMLEGQNVRTGIGFALGGSLAMFTAYYATRIRRNIQMVSQRPSPVINSVTNIISSWKLILKEEGAKTKTVLLKLASIGSGAIVYLLQFSKGGDLLPYECYHTLSPLCIKNMTEGYNFEDKLTAMGKFILNKSNAYTNYEGKLKITEIVAIAFACLASFTYVFQLYYKKLENENRVYVVNPSGISNMDSISHNVHSEEDDDSKRVVAYAKDDEKRVERRVEARDAHLTDMPNSINTSN